jgi:hypothetical protein
MAHRSKRESQVLRKTHVPAWSRPWKYNAPLVLLIFIVSLFPGPLCAKNLNVLESNGIRLLFEPSQEPTARELIRIYPEVRAELAQIFGWDLPPAPSVRLTADSHRFQQWGQSPLTVAFALPQRNFIVIDTTRMTAHPFSLRNTFKHELCHLLLHHHIHSDRLPRWLDEGIAQWASDGAGDILMDQKRSVLNRVTLGGRFIPLDALTRGFPRNDQDLMLAYEESKSFIEYLIGTSGPDGVLKVLNEMKQGEDAKSAFLNVYGTSLNQLEREWQRSLRNRITWFTYLSYHLYDILFVLAALMSIYGFIRIMIKKRQRMKEEVETEELENPSIPESLNS